MRLRDERIQMLKEHTDREKEVFHFFNQIIAETTIIYLKDANDKDQIPLRIQMIIIFSLIDVLGSYWYEYLGQSGKTNERAQAWYEAFCATDRNPHYQGLWRELTSTRLYAFRNALVHFFGFGEENEGLSIILAASNLSEKMRLGMEEDLLVRGHKTIVMRPNNFSDLIKEGAIIMLHEWGSTIQAAQSEPVREAEYIAGIERVWKKVRKEGATGISEKEIPLDN